MKKVVEVKAARSSQGPFMYGYDAEAVVLDEETMTKEYVCASYFDECTEYTVSRESVHERLVEMAHELPEFTEEYWTLEKAMESEHGKLFKVLDDLVTLMYGEDRK